MRIRTCFHPVPGFLFTLLLFSFSPVLAADKAGAIPIPNFVELEPGLFRGGSPGEAGVLYLKELGVKTIVDLETTASVLSIEEKAAANAGMKMIKLPMSGFWSPRDATVNAALDHVANPALRPLFVHCKHGQDRTGLIVGLFRVEYENWQPGHAYEEMKRIGFHPALFLLNHYFEKRTGFED